eukprot:TRINITY_DN9866_c0_g1_i5.p1 TRINITY_DN9866_c0_g1~~TRINITY_DN9866_c0_g1_i5.p1  ORF type:complete len:120 (+),score=15.96 TRINITY_DN9866_c0_g1_i5:28-387(+)
MAEVIVEFDAVKKASEKKSPVILDVRDPDGHAGGHIPSALNLPFSQFADISSLSSDQFKKKYKFDLPEKDVEIITHCNKGGRATKAYHALKEAGFTNVQLYKGSFHDWKAKGGEVIVPE